KSLLFDADASEGGIYISEMESETLLINGNLTTRVTQDIVDKFIARWNRTYEYMELGYLTKASVPADMSKNFLSVKEFDTYFQDHENAISERTVEGTMLGKEWLGLEGD